MCGDLTGFKETVTILLKPRRRFNISHTITTTYINSTSHSTRDYELDEKTVTD